MERWRLGAVLREMDEQFDSSGCSSRSSHNRIVALPSLPSGYMCGQGPGKLSMLEAGEHPLQEVGLLAIKRRVRHALGLHEKAFGGYSCGANGIIRPQSDSTMEANLNTVAKPSFHQQAFRPGGSVSFMVDKSVQNKG